jgi:putative SOS response-associated peptidase YedK
MKMEIRRHCMCGRFTITLDPADFQQEFDLGKMPGEWKPRYNVAPTQDVPVVKDIQTREVEMMHWGLIPFWAKEKDIGARMINARSETLSEKPAFRQAFKQRRCLILADGFFEWQRKDPKTPKVPMYFQLKNGKPFAFAGLWESWHETPKKELHSCTIITCEPNELVAQIHNRMPVILDKANCWRWLEDLETQKLQGLLTPYPAEMMQTHAVGRLVNNPGEDNPEVIRPLAF